MIQSTTTQLPDELVSLAPAVRDALEEAVGQPFRLWQHTEAWQPMRTQQLLSETPHPTSDAAPDCADDFAADIAAALNQQTWSEQAVIVNVAGGRQVLAAPLQAAGRTRWLIVGCIDPSTGNIARALADSLLRSHKLSCDLQTTTRELDHCIFQITANFEELTWLRSLSEQFELCNLKDGLARAAQSALPTLRTLLYAQELFLFGPGNRCQASDAESGAETPNRELPLLSYDGDGAVSEEAARRVLAETADREAPQAIVWNSPSCADTRSDPTTIRNYVLTPVLKSRELHGWLLAINKDMPLDDPLWSGSERYDQNLIEFGTTEAGLLSTMAVMLATHGKNVELLKEKESLLVGVIRALVNTIDAKDAYTCGHSDRVAMISKKIAQQLGQSSEDCEQAYMGGLLHDIGKIGVPDYVLGKPDRLTAEEYELIKTHPEKGVEILKHLTPFTNVLPGVLHHHEAFNGSGYPAGLAGEQIPLLGRIISVADSYDAMTSSRTYRKGMPTEKAEDILRSGVGVHWDGAVIDAFFAARREIYAICGTGGIQKAMSTAGITAMENCPV